VQARLADEGLPGGRRSQAGTTALSGGQAQPAPASSRFNPLAVPLGGPVSGLRLEELGAGWA